MTSPTDPIDEEERELLLLEAKLLVERSSLEFDEAQYNSALDFAQQALVIFETHGNEGSELPALMMVAHVLRIQGRRSEALVHFRQCLETARKVGDRTRAGDSLHQIGVIHVGEHEYDQAHLALLEALAIAEETGNRLSVGQLQRNIGSVHYNQGRFNEALTYYERALAIAKQAGMVGAWCENLGSIGSIHRIQGDPARAMHCFREAASLAEESGKPLIKSRYLAKIATTLEGIGQHEEALELKLQGLQIARETNNRLHQGHHLCNIGNSYARVGQREQAESCFREGIRICDDMDTACAGYTRGVLALLLSKSKRFDEALQLLKDGEPLIAPIPLYHGVFLCKKGEVLRLVGDVDGARAALKQAEELATELNLADKGDLSQAIAELSAMLG